MVRERVETRAGRAEVVGSWGDPGRRRWGRGRLGRGGGREGQEGGKGQQGRDEHAGERNVLQEDRRPR